MAGIGGKAKGTKNWTKEEEEFLINNWGRYSIKYLENKLKRSQRSIKMKAYRLDLGSIADTREEIYLKSFLRAIGYSSNGIVKKLENDNFPMKVKKRGNRVYRLVRIDEFWKWAEKNKTKINLNKMEINILGKEPEWVKEKRRLDFKRPKNRVWTVNEENLLRSKASTGRFTVHDLALDFNRTQPSIRKKLNELVIKAHSDCIRRKYTKEDEDKIKELLYKGASYSYISMKLGRTEEGISDKVRRMIKRGEVLK